MADPDNERNPLETLSLAGVGAVALIAQHADELASEIGARLGVERDEVRAVIADRPRQLAPRGHPARRERRDVRGARGIRARCGFSRVGGRPRLRVAQLEHRVKLLERGRDT